VSWLVARARAGLGPLETVVVAFLFKRNDQRLSAGARLKTSTVGPEIQTV
jgi:hypothetical protein